MALPSQTSEEAFLRSYHAAQVWCAANADSASPESCLRSAALEPTSPLVDMAIVKDLVGRGFSEYDDLFSRRVTEVARLAARRDELLSTSHAPSGGREGKLLVFDVESTMFETISEARSGGFFDKYDCPPWDTWIAYVVEAWGKAPHAPGWPPQAYLVSWVPEELVALAHRGVTDNPVGCLHWLDDVKCADLPFLRSMSQGGLL